MIAAMSFKKVLLTLSWFFYCFLITSISPLSFLFIDCNSLYLTSAFSS